MRLSIRNQLTGTVSAISEGEVMATVKTRLPGGQEVTAAITREAVQELGIEAGTEVQVLIKSTEVSLATERVEGISIRNQLPGTVTAITTGGAMASVKVAVDGNGELTSAITAEAVRDLGLAVGATVVALVKSTEISLATG
ncbi:TOBE domain-containing protein [Actinocrispum wychmicini]|uniref:Molybdate transport system regulatory protein n=1 Tax=Actinocrispum wychmicini TaxID=1213861 RepID=A0A4R2JHD9_9PSEU|nr:TOBE domain-containing protein [Actinocrispum wychmicini]TCO53555.1 molybdate transport system regulatory protein [Actinocrispum wychmicini]